MKFDQVISRIQSGILQLPGHSAQVLMAPGNRKSTLEYLQEFPSYKPSSVMAVLFPDKDATRMLLIERAERNDLHSGQISFPGGRREMDDASLLDTAFREMYEEVGISPDKVKVLGQLSDLYIPVSNFLVHPFVAYSTGIPSVRINHDEVKQVLLPEIDCFLSEMLLRDKFPGKSSGLIDAPYYSFGEHKIWGATAMVISELAYILKK
jgi:8-oxo-dGTP pyrophosphatase MutT (NUDIX family)